jgi:CrcB protein
MVAQEKIVNPALIAAVAIGGALGSVARYLVAIGVGRAFGTSFPWGILIINITGSALIGAMHLVRALA